MTKQKVFKNLLISLLKLISEANQSMQIFTEVVLTDFEGSLKLANEGILIYNTNTDKLNCS